VLVSICIPSLKVIARSRNLTRQSCGTSLTLLRSARPRLGDGKRLKRHLDRRLGPAGGFHVQPGNSSSRRCRSASSLAFRVRYR
jgi:hypothetical protein